MQSFIHRKNLENYRKQLAETEDEAQLNLIRKLLAEEEAKKPPAPRREDS